MALFRTEHARLSDERLMELIVRGDKPQISQWPDFYQTLVP